MKRNKWKKGEKMGKDSTNLDLLRRQMRKTMEIVRDFIFWTPESLQMVMATMKLKDACSLEEKL